ncbi:unnamed protein product [Rotaria sp. Silwood2]|nr:unnamed protein product [Rotaria sp. Silwood2]CAF2854298.1 unnamed protein product [Rotaria sp. Silwood2]CAF3343812.1 unnamed protein product [Rotaria sp. Silwood2]CAF4187244.1 unnamed protein product [Rotaria sp. Silwood2]CAF4258435.1 unnamed protein product [Rotaria sp. Silwood2]
MENYSLRFKIISFKDSVKNKLDDTLFYIKKFVELPTEYGDTIKLEQNQITPPMVISIKETFDWKINDGKYCQIICLTPKSKIIADTVLWFDGLLHLINDPRYNERVHSELLCSMILREEYGFEFSLQPIEISESVISSSRFARKNYSHSKKPSQELILGHSMEIKQFMHPVHCAVCQGFIWGVHHQGFECSQCSLVAHKKCRQDIKFWCQKSSNPVYSDRQHIFKEYEAAFVRAFVSRNHSYCSHCGAQIFRNGLKCKRCSLIIHERCRSKVPPVCITSNEPPLDTTATYRHVIGARFHGEKIKKNRQHSQSSSFDLSWLDPLPKLSIKDQQRILLPKFNDFKFIGRLGDGATGQVYCVQHNLSKQYFAVKVANGANEETRQQLEVERHILFRYSDGNPYIIKAYCAFHQGTKLFLVMELIQGGTLYHKIQTTRMNEDEIRYYLAQLVCVIQYLHSNSIIYRDLKLEHAMISSTGSIRLVDFGLGRLLKTPDEICHTMCGTPSYMAPEVRRLEDGSSNEGYSYAIDFWTLGIMFVQMLCHDQIDFTPLFSNNNEDTIEPKKITEYLELPRYISLEAHSCVVGLLEYDPEKRLGSPDSPHGSIRDHPFFKVGHRINWSEIDGDLFKPGHRNSENIRIVPSTSINEQLSDLQMDRGRRAKDDWIAAGESTCTSDENERLKLFDYINESSWREFISSNVL